MAFPEKHNGLYTDHYELVMAQGYYLSGLNNYPACFDYFFRKNPFKGGYVVFAGLSDLVEIVENLKFDKTDLEFLASIGFEPDFLEYLSTFSFKGNIYSVKEGEIVFPNEPVLRIEGGLAETQIIETMVLNILNFESLIATKACRMRYSAGDKVLMDFGLRRAQGFGGIHASKAAVIGGFDQTSNVFSAFSFGLKSSGTMAHSWIQNFGDELEAFRIFARHYPDNCVLLVDTYDTLKSGIPNAVKVAKELKKNGHKLAGIRLDSGDLAYLSKKSREMLDMEGLDYVKIVASNQLNEHVIRSLEHQKAPIDIFGVGTALVTGQDDPALDGVYKLSMSNHLPSMKFSENEAKETLPGIKNILRFYDDQGKFLMDGVLLDYEKNGNTYFHPLKPEKKTNVSSLKRESLHHMVMDEGKRSNQFSNISLEDIIENRKQRFNLLPEEYKRFENPHLYKVGISKELLNLKNKLKEEFSNESTDDS